jgi:hypothetical protein
MLVQDGADAKSEFVVANLRLVVSLARRHAGGGMDLVDLIQGSRVSGARLAFDIPTVVIEPLLVHYAASVYNCGVMRRMR